MVADPLQVARVSFLKGQSGETCLRSSLVPGVNEVPGNVDADNFSSHPRQGNGRGTITAAEVQHPQRRRYSERLYNGFSRLTHQGGNLRKVALLPQCFVRVHNRLVHSFENWE